MGTPDIQKPHPLSGLFQWISKRNPGDKLENLIGTLGRVGGMRVYRTENCFGTTGKDSIFPHTQV